MNSRNQKQTHNNQTHNRKNFRNTNSTAARPAHLNESRRMLDDFETCQRMERQLRTPHFPQNQQRDRNQEEHSIAPNRFEVMNKQRGPAPGPFLAQDNNIPDRAPHFSERRPAGAQSFYENQRQRAPEFNHSPVRNSSVFQRRSNNSPQQQFTSTRPRSRSPGHVPERMSPRRSPWRVREEDYPRRSREPPAASNRPAVEPRQSGFKNNWEPQARPEHKNNPIEVPQQGESDTKFDRNKRNLCGSRTKWYMRYIKQGFSRDEAYRMAKEPTQPAVNYRPELNRQQGKPRSAMHKPSTAVKCTSPTLNRRSPDLNSRSPELKRRKPSWDDEGPGPSKRPEAEEERLKISLMPLGYPREKLTHQEKLDLEEAITIEVASSSLGVPLRFTAVAFKTGYLEVECFNQFSADWLMRTGSHLPTYYGHPVEAKLNLQEKEQIITVSLPRSAGKSEEFLLQLIKSQNILNVDLWTVVDRADNDSGDAVVVLNIDDASAAEIAGNDHTIFYRMSRIHVDGLQPVDNGQKMSAKEVPRRSKDHSPSFNRNRDGNFGQNY